MSFTVKEYRDLLELLAAHPEWREELRRALLSEDFLALPSIVRELTEAQKIVNQQIKELVEAQKHTEQRVNELAEAQRLTEQRVNELAEAQKRTEQRVNELAEAQKRTEQKLEELAEAQRQTEQKIKELTEVVNGLVEAQKRTEQRVNELTEAQKRTEQRVNELAEAQKRTEQRVNELTEAQKRTEKRVEELTEAQTRTEKRVDDLSHNVKRLEQRVSRLDGRMLEMEYERKASSYFGRILRRAQAVNWNVLEEITEGKISQAEMDELSNLDLVVQGKWRHSGTNEEREQIWLAIEVSVVIDRNDIERVVRRAEIMRKAGLLTLPVTAGENITNGAQRVAKEKGVIVFLDGSMWFLEEAKSLHLT